VITSRIHRLVLKNFRIHRSLDLQFDDLNFILGINDGGKTTVARALRWVLLNDGGRFEDIVHTGESSVSVSVMLGDDVVIARERSSSTNRYSISEDGGSSWETYDGVGTGVHPAVYALTGMAPVSLDIGAKGETFDLNFMDTRGGLFLVNETAGTLEKLLGGIGGAEIVEDAAKRAKSSRLDSGRRVDAARTEIDRLTVLVEAGKPLEQVPALAESINSLGNTVDQLETDHTTLVQLRTARQTLVAPTPVPDGLDALTELMLTQVKDLLDLGATAEGLTTLNAHKPQPPTEFSAVAVDGKVHEIEVIIEYVDAEQVIFEQWSAFFESGKKTALDRVEATACQAEAARRLDNAKENLRVILTDAGVCPTCLQTIPAGYSIEEA